MSTSITLQADLTLLKNRRPLSFDLTIPNGTVVVFVDAADQDAAAEMLAQISPQTLYDNLSQVQRTIQATAAQPQFTLGEDVLVTYGAYGQRQYHGFSMSPSPSGSPSLSPSASVSLSPSSSVSSSHSASPSSSHSASPSAS